MATDNNAKAKPEPWYPFNSGPPKDKAQLEAGADGQRPKPEPWYPFEAGRPKAQPEQSHVTTAKAETAAPSPKAAPAANPADFKRETPAFAAAQVKPDMVERLKPQSDVIRPSWEPAKPLVEKPQQVSLSSPGPDVSKVAKSDAPAHSPVVARVHIHPPTPPRSAFGEKLHAEAKEMNRANGVIGSALAQGLPPDAIKAVVENRLHGHAREIASNVLAGAADAQGVAEKLGDSQKVASALQAAASKAVNASHAETIVASRLKGEAATAGVSAVQALASPTPTITLSEQQLAAADPMAPVSTFELPEVKVAGPQEAASATALAAQTAAPEPVTAPTTAPAAIAEQPQVASVEQSGVITYPVPTPESQPLSMADNLAATTSAPTVQRDYSPEDFKAIIESVSGPTVSKQAYADFGAAAGLEGVAVSTSQAGVGLLSPLQPQSSIGPDISLIQAASANLSAAGAASVPQVDSLAASAAAGMAASTSSILASTAPVSTAELAAATASVPVKPEGAVEERSTLASVAPTTKAGVVVEDRSTQASAADSITALSAKAANEMAQNSYSGVVGAKLAEAFGSDSHSKANVAVEDRSTQASAADAAAARSAQAATEMAQNSYSGGVGAKLAEVFSSGSANKPEVAIEDRSVKASAADVAAMTAKAEAPTSYSSAVGDKLRDAFSAATNISDTLSSVVKSGLDKGEASLKGAADSVAQVIQSASAAGAKVSLEDALASHMQNKGFDAQSIAAAGEIAQAIRDDLRQGPQPAGSVLVLHKDGGDLASVVQAKDLPSVARPGDSVLAMDTLEKVADKGMDTGPIKEVRGAMPEAVQNRSDLELAQSVGPAKSEMKGLDQAQSPEQAAQKQERSAAAEQSREAAAAMSMS